MIEWQQIRTEYEQGVSLRSLAAKYDVPKTTLIRRRDAEGWTRPSGPVLVHTGPGKTDTRGDIPGPPVSPPPADAVTIAQLGLKQLAQHLRADGLLSLSSHKALADSLSQYVKVLLLAPREAGPQDGLVIPLEKLLPSTRAAIRRVLEEDERQQQA